MRKNKNSSWLFTMATVLVTTLGAIASAEDLKPAKGWSALQHATVTRTDRNEEVLYEVVTATMYGKRLPNGAAVPKLLVLREKTAARCADASCVYRYSTFSLADVKEKDGVRNFDGTPVELDADFTKYQSPADYVVTALALQERRDPANGRSSWTLDTKLKEGDTVTFTGTAFTARPNPTVVDSRVGNR